MRHERFPNQRSSKLAPRGDGPFRVLEKINDNAYRLELPSELNVSSTFNVTDLSPFSMDEQVLRSKHFQEGGNDEDIVAEEELEDNEDQPEDDQAKPKAPTIPEGAITRNRARVLQYKFDAFIEKLLDQEHNLRDDQEEPPDQAKAQEPWALLAISYQGHSLTRVQD